MKEFEKSALRYEQNISINPHFAHRMILDRINDNSSVLEFGPGAGVMTRKMATEKNCKVSIVEIDKECFDVAMSYACDGICGDIETYEWKSHFSQNTYDYIIFVDVLEHLRNPWTVLKEVQSLLKDNGSILISVPNVSHNSVIIQLINNRFVYGDTGILDYTHLHHFTFSEIIGLVDSCELTPVYLDATYISVGKNEFDVSYGDVDPLLEEYLKKRPFGEVYQHIFEVKKKEFVEKENIPVDNRIGTPLTYIDCVETERERNEKEKDADINAILCKDPNFFFGSNEEIARMRLELNDLYSTYGELDILKNYASRISDLQEDLDRKNKFIFELNKSEEEKNKRIGELQSEEEERNKHIKYLDSQISDYQERINSLLLGQNENIKELQNKEKEIIHLQTEESEKEEKIHILEENLDNKQCYIEQLLEAERGYQKELTDCQQKVLNKEGHIEQLLEAERGYQREIADYQQKVLNKEGHIEQLLEVEREYERERNSKTYRLAVKFRKVFAFFFPENSKRRFFAKILVKCVRHPRLMARMITFKRIKHFISTSKNEGMESVFRKYKEAEELEKSHLNPFDANKYKVTEVNENNEEQKKIDDYKKITFDTVQKPAVSIVIPVYNQFDYTYQCLASIKEQSGDVTYEVIIADDCSNDLTEQINSVVDGIKVVRNKNNLRFLKNCNNAAKQAKGEYILFLNNDTQVQENWLEPLISLMKDETIGMVGSKLVYADGWLQEAGGIIWKDASAWNYGNRQNPNDSEFNYVRETDYISGAAIMIRHSLWKEIGGFDERFAPAYCEDSDLAFEVRKHGYKVVYQPKSVVIHFEGVSNGTDLTSGQKKYQVDNQVKFFEKWKDVLEKENFENGQDVFFARGKSKDKKHVFFLDHYVPTYDRDAGSKTTMMYLKMLVSKGYQITFWPDNFYQEEPYTSELQQMGIMVLYGPKYAQDWKQWLKDNLNNFDIIYLNRPHITIKYIDIIKSIPHKGKIIYYGHDLHFLRTQREYELTHDNKKLQESKEWKKQELYIMKQTDMNYYPSILEEEAIHEIDPVIPVKAITAYVFDEFKEVKYEMEKREGLLFVGGFGHDPNVDAVLWFVDKIYPEVYKRTKAPFYIVGAKAPQKIKEIKQEGVVFKGFVTEEELKELYNSSRIDIVPLRYGAGVKGKVVEALYNGIPIVTTSVGAEGIDGVDKVAVVKDGEEDLINAICEIYNNKKTLSYMSKNELEYVKTHFSTESVWKIIEKDFQ